MQSYLDPALAGERELRRKLRDMETREQAEDGTLGLDPTGRGYITLNFFNLFWIFVVCSVFGLVIETVYHVLVVDPGVYEDRAGLLFGPFSPIYGVGAMLMTMALNRFHKAPFPVIFLVSAVIGGAFEYAVSWFMQFAFGIVAWDYTGTFLSIDGRTNGMFMAMWGVLGPVLGEAVPALDAATGQPYPLELALYADHRMRRLDDRRLRHDLDVARPLVPARGRRSARQRHLPIHRRSFRQPVHGGPLPEHVDRPGQRSTNAVSESRIADARGPASAISRKQSSPLPIERVLHAAYPGVFRPQSG